MLYRALHAAKRGSEPFVVRVRPTSAGARRFVASSLLKLGPGLAPAPFSTQAPFAKHMQICIHALLIISSDACDVWSHTPKESSEDFRTPQVWIIDRDLADGRTCTSQSSQCVTHEPRGWRQFVDMGAQCLSVFAAAWTSPLCFFMVSCGAHSRKTFESACRDSTHGCASPPM